MNKLKRYTLGRVTLAKTENASLQGAGIVECKNGEFVRYKDVENLLEAIGAGGVSGRITQKTLEQHRAEFLEHWDYIHGHGLDGGWEAVAWAAWKAARGVHDEQK